MDFFKLRLSLPLLVLLLLIIQILLFLMYIGGMGWIYLIHPKDIIVIKMGEKVIEPEIIISITGFALLYLFIWITASIILTFFWIRYNYSSFFNCFSFKQYWTCFGQCWSYNYLCTLSNFCKMDSCILYAYRKT